jgi:hypothetical protein
MDEAEGLRIRAARDSAREAALAVPLNAGAVPVTRYGTCGHLYGYDGFLGWHPTPLIAALRWAEQNP